MGTHPSRATPAASCRPAGFTRPTVAAPIRSARRGTRRGRPGQPRARMTADARPVRVTPSGPTTSTVRPRYDGSSTTRAVASATSSTLTHQIGRSPLPNTSGRRPRPAVDSTISRPSSANAAARTTVKGAPLATSACSAAYFIRAISRSWSAEAPVTLISTTSAPARPAARTSSRLPSRSTDSRDTSLPTIPWTAETTSRAFTSARSRSAGRRTSPRTTSTSRGRPTPTCPRLSTRTGSP